MSALGSYRGLGFSHSGWFYPDINSAAYLPGAVDLLVDTAINKFMGPHTDEHQHTI